MLMCRIQYIWRGYLKIWPIGCIKATTVIISQKGIVGNSSKNNISYVPLCKSEKSSTVRVFLVSTNCLGIAIYISPRHALWFTVIETGIQSVHIWQIPNSWNLGITTCTHWYGRNFAKQFPKSSLCSNCHLLLAQTAQCACLSLWPCLRVLPLQDPKVSPLSIPYA